MKTFGLLDYAVLAALLLASSLIGVYFWYKERKSQSNANYLTGGRNLSVFPVSMSLIASFMSTNTLLGAPAEIYQLGTQFVVSQLGFLISILLAAHVFMPIYYNLELTSVHKYLLRRFGANSIRILGSIGFIMCTLPYMGVVLYGPALALNSVMPLSITSSILIVGVICTFYTAIGGIKAVVWTDVLQCILMLSGLLLVIVNGCLEMGISEPFRIAQKEGRLVLFNFDFNLYRSDTFWAVFLGSVAGWGGTYCVKQTQVQRYCCLKSQKKAKIALYWNIPGVISIALLAIWCGIIIFAKYHNCDPVQLNLIKRYDQLMPYYVMDTLSHIPGLPGFFVVCIFSGALSTLSSGFNALATVFWDDFLKRYFRDIEDSKAVLINKFIATFFGLLAIAIAFIVGKLGTVLQASIALSGSFTGPLFGLFCLGIFFSFVNAKGAFLGLLSGVGLCITISFGTVINKKPMINLPLYINECPIDIYDAVSFTELRNISSIAPADYDPVGLNKLFHVSYFLIPFIGFVVCVVVGIIVSLLTGCHGEVESHLVFTKKRGSESKFEMTNIPEELSNKQMDLVISEVKNRAKNINNNDIKQEKISENLLSKNVELIENPLQNDTQMNGKTEKPFFV